MEQEKRVIGESGPQRTARIKNMLQMRLDSQIQAEKKQHRKFVATVIVSCAVAAIGIGAGVMVIFTQFGTANSAEASDNAVTVSTSSFNKSQTQAGYNSRSGFITIRQEIDYQKQMLAKKLAEHASGTPTNNADESRKVKQTNNATTKKPTKQKTDTKAPDNQNVINTEVNTHPNTMVNTEVNANATTRPPAISDETRNQTNEPATADKKSADKKPVPPKSAESDKTPSQDQEVIIIIKK